MDLSLPVVGVKGPILNADPSIKHPLNNKNKTLSGGKFTSILLYHLLAFCVQENKTLKNIKLFFTILKWYSSAHHCSTLPSHSATYVLSLECEEEQLMSFVCSCYHSHIFLTFIVPLFNHSTFLLKTHSNTFNCRTAFGPAGPWWNLAENSISLELGLRKLWPCSRTAGEF